MAQRWTDTVALELQKMVATLSYGIVNYRHPMRAKALSAIRSSYARTRTFTTPLECMEIWQAVQACEKVPGDIAEAGVYLGGTARLILTANTTKRMHLFDTFQGLPSSEGTFTQGEYAASRDQVLQNLADFTDRLELHQGFFPDSAVGLEDLRFSFVHLDLDLYQSTHASLEWFWPRMNPGGIILSHDYPFADGVVRAFQEFFATRTEPLLALSGSQCMAVKG